MNYTVEQGLSNNTVLSIAEDKSGNMWFGTNGGVSKYDGESFMNYTVEQGLANSTVYSIAEDKSGNLWFGTYGGGISKYDGESFMNYTMEQGLVNNSVRSIAEDKSGNMWFGTNDGVSKYDGESFINYTVEQGLANNAIYSLAEDKSGNLWFGTQLGLNVVEFRSSAVTNSSNEINIRNVTKYLNDLPDKTIGAIQFDKKGRMILGTNFGLYVLSAEEVATVLKNTSKVKGTVYNQFTGYPVKDINYGGNNNGATCIDNKGVFWVGHGSNGITRVNLDAVNKSSEAPNVIINKVSLKGEDVCFYSLYSADSTVLAQQEIATYGQVLSQAERDTLQQRFEGITFDGITKWFPLPDNLVLPYEHNALTFEFNAIETGRNFMVNYQFMLKGMDDEWSPITKKHEATYNNLSEGDYTFLLKAQSPWGVWSEPTEFKFTVLPPWFRTWWMYTVYFLLSVLFVWGLIKMQTKRLKERQKELESEVELATIEIRAQKEQVEEAHKEITDSINYAERIQRSFLATTEILEENLKDYFVFFQPKDVVSGDFYWAGKLNNGNFSIVNADSTGHGVPGAIMSILNISSLEKAVETEVEPHHILNVTRNLIVERLKKDGSKEGGKDGMDCSLLVLNTDKSLLTFAAANNPVWIIRNNELIEYKADRMPVGRGEKNAESFALKTVPLVKGDVIYTLTDGFPDQFGGEKGKKFMTKKLKALILSIAQTPMAEQQEKLKNVFTDWKGNEEQVDDVCIIGFRI
tara:strand:- start:7586 stop:9826 length:2241 start_codon:yes stop_codon:yes gene_type:complete